MVRRIELVNFMSHRQTVIEPAAGLTVLVGPNNCGKSAVVSALQILCDNVRGDYIVRHGEDECRIMVETEEGHSIEWRRIKGTQSYCIDGEEVQRLQGGLALGARVDVAVDRLGGLVGESPHHVGHQLVVTRAVRIGHRSDSLGILRARSARRVSLYKKERLGFDSSFGATV